MVFSVWSCWLSGLARVHVFVLVSPRARETVRVGGGSDSCFIPFCARSRAARGALSGWLKLPTCRVGCRPRGPLARQHGSPPLARRALPALRTLQARQVQGQIETEQCEYCATSSAWRSNVCFNTLCVMSLHGSLQVRNWAMWVLCHFSCRSVC